jgi:DNA-directed RNA polymerase sigma subunit (sigma70/sigma32)
MYLSFSEYLRIAQRVVGKASYNGIQNSEDNIAYVAEFLMLADTRYKEECGLTRDEFRALYAKYARLNLFNKKKRKRFENSLDWDYTSQKGGKEVSLKEVLEDKKAEKPFVNVESEELINTINNSPLNDKEKNVLKDYLFSKDSLSDIGRTYGVNPRYVGILINSAVKKIDIRLKQHV